MRRWVDTGVINTKSRRTAQTLVFAAMKKFQVAGKAYFLISQQKPESIPFRSFAVERRFLVLSYRGARFLMA